MLERRIKQEIRDFLDGDRKEALMVTGARQVGKTYIIRECAKEIYKNIGGLKNYQPAAEFAGEVLEKQLHKNIAKTRYCDDKKITDHYAIIPTGRGFLI